MACKYCGKDNPLVFEDSLTGGVCEACVSKVKSKLDSTKADVSVFYKKLDSLGLLRAFMTYLDMVKRDTKLFHFDGVKMDKRSKFPYVLVFKALSPFDAPQIIEIGISVIKPEGNKSLCVVKGKYRLQDESNILYVDPWGTFYEGTESFIGSNMSWVKKEFGLD